MRSCRVSVWRYAWVWACFAVAIGLSAGPTFAQTPRSLLPTKPLDLRASPSPGAIPAPSPGIGATDTDASSGVDAGSTAKPGKVGIDVGALGLVTVENVGTIGIASGGFAADLWLGTPRETIDVLMRMLPTSSSSPVLADLRRRLLLSTAAVPQPSEPSGESFLWRRASTLFQTGDLASVEALLAVVPPTHQEEALSKLTADVAFLTNDLSKACDVAAAWVEHSQDRYWQKALIFCEALNGAWERVDFGMRLLIELGEDDEPFFALMRGIGGETDAASGLGHRSLRPLDVAMARAARATLPGVADEMPAAWLLRGYMEDPGVPLRARIAIAEQAERAGVAKPEELTRIYGEMQVSPELLESAVSVANADPGPRGRALLFRATRAQGSAFGRAQAIEQAREVASTRHLFGQMARVYAPIVREFEASSQLAWFAADAALLLVAAGDLEAARPWLDVAEREVAFGPEAGDAWRRVWPLVRLAAGDTLLEWRAEQLQAWWDRTRVNDPQAANEKAALLFGLLSALADPVPSTAWRGLIGENRRTGVAGAGLATGPDLAIAPDLATTRALSDAIDQGRLGEAVALVLITLGTSPFDALSPVVLVNTVSALKDLGLEQDARLLAFEIATAAGL
ncbi:MAG: hypothetical protein O3B74_01775 [Proteobacteria bacterium]|nr:hypothetical protein [Pseudomonadota bacterium]